MAVKELTEAQKKAIMDSMYVGTIPFLDRRMQRDPRTLVAASLAEAGADRSPAVGGWAEGLSRVASGLAGGYFNKKNEERYKVAEDDLAARALAAQESEIAKSQEKVNTAQQFINGVNGPQGAAPPAAATPPPVDPNARVAAALAPNTLGEGAFTPSATPVAANPLSPPATGALPSQQAIPATPEIAASVPVAASASTRPRVLQPGQSARAPSSRPDTGFASYRSSAYDPLEEKYAAQYGIPVELLRSIRLNGEKSNANQVSSAGAKSVYQFTPETRAGFMKKHGFDPWASPENAVRAAAMHLSADWKRSGGDARETALSYIAGPSGKGRGRVSRAYADRVVGGMGGAGGGMPESGIVTADTVIDPNQYAIEEAPLPPEPERPKMPDMPDRVRSMRLAVAQNLLAQNKDLNAGMLYGLVQPEYEAGVEEERASKEAEYDKLTQLINFRHQAEMQNWSQKDVDRYQAMTNEFKDTREFNRDLRTKGYEYAQQAREARIKHREAMQLQRQQDAAAMARTKESNTGTKVPVGMQNAFKEAEVGRRAVTDIMDMVKANPNEVGIMFLAPEKITSRTSPAGVQMRARLSDFTSLRLHTRSGASVTVEEFARQRGWYPSENDDAAAIQNKMAMLLKGIQDEQDVIRTMYPNADVFAGFSPSPVATAGANAADDAYLEQMYGIKK